MHLADSAVGKVKNFTSKGKDALQINARFREAYAPGQHGQGRKNYPNMGCSFEKQKTKRYYGVLESQFRKYFDMAVKKKGITGENLLQILELRLDNVVYRMGLAASRPEARQLVRHGHFAVNGKKVNIPSYLVKLGDVVTVKDKSKSSPKMKDNKELAAGRPSPKWLEYDTEEMTGKIAALPLREDIDLPIKESLIVELYSK